MKFSVVPVFLLLLSFSGLNAQDKDFEALRKAIDLKIDDIEAKTIQWRRHFHEYPELSNQEFETAKIIADHLRNLGLEVKTGIAKTGVTGLLVGGKPGPVVAIRADMDALPVTEDVDLPYASKVTAIYNGQETGVMHACGHDGHMAILMATAEVLTSVREELPGSVKFIFQPAEEMAPNEESWGAELMISEGVLEDPVPDVIFGLHMLPGPARSIRYNSNAIMASVDNFRIVVSGRGTHGAMPWQGIDPIVAASSIVLNLQTIVSRNVELSNGAAVITVGSIHGGNRNNIISDDVQLLGTIRTHNDVSRELIHRRIREVVDHTAASYGAKATVELDIIYPATVNDPTITSMMLPALEKAAGKENVARTNPIMPAEDFSFYLRKIPGLYFFLGITPDGIDPAESEANHSPRFVLDESALKTGIRAFCYLVLEYAKHHK
jgi:amidohydrolase